MAIQCDSTTELATLDGLNHDYREPIQQSYNFTSQEKLNE